MLGMQFDFTKLNEKVYYKILEDCDDSNVITNDLLV